MHCDVCCRPFWLSPRQAVVIPVAPPFDDYAKKVSVSMCFLNLQSLCCLVVV